MIPSLILRLSWKRKRRPDRRRILVVFQSLLLLRRRRGHRGPARFRLHRTLLLVLLDGEVDVLVQQLSFLLRGLGRLRRARCGRLLLRVGQRRQLRGCDTARHRERGGDCDRAWRHTLPFSFVGSRRGLASASRRTRRRRTSAGSCPP